MGIIERLTEEHRTLKELLAEGQFGQVWVILQNHVDATSDPQLLKIALVVTKEFKQEPSLVDVFKRLHDKFNALTATL
jgi:hypothetical protein